MKVLIVDDTPENVYMLESLLKGYGYEVSTAVNGIEALEHLKQEPATLIISDILMPKMDGFQLCRAVKADDALKNIPFIFYTATYTTEKDKDFALSLGASRFILKPADPEEFISIIKEVLAENKIGLLKPGDITIEKETEYLKEHQARLIKKLGDKITELERSEELYRSLIFCAIDAIITLDDSGMITSWNEAAEQIFDYESDEVIGKQFSLLFPEELRSEQDALIMRLKEKKLTRCLETVSRKKSGVFIPVEISLSLMQDKLGKNLGISAIIRDITERKAHEVEIERLNRLYAALSQVNQAIVRVHSRDELFSEVCRVLVEFGGFKLVWLGWHDTATHKVTVVAKAGDETGYLNEICVFADDRPEGCGPTGTAIKEGKSSIFNDFLNDPHALPWREAATRTSWRAAAAFPIRLADEVCGALTVYVLETNFFGDREVALLEEVAMDVSFGLDNLEREAQRQRAEAAVRESALQLETAVRAGNVWLWNLDLHTNTVFFSSEWKHHLGYEDHEISDDFTEWQNLVHPDDLESSIQNVRAFIEKPWPDYHVEFRLRHKDGSYRWILAQASLINDDQGKPVRMLGSNVDITEQRKLEDQLRQAQKMEAVGQLAGGISHDFNNILSAIVGYGHVCLMKMAGGDPLRPNIEQILEAADRAAYLTKDLLLFSRHQVSDRKAVDLNEIVRTMEKFLKRVIREDIAYEMTLHKGTTPVLADVHQLEQVLMNLATNARDAMPQGGTFTIATEQIMIGYEFITVHGYGNPGMYALLTVADTGTGMDEQTRRRIFEPFFTTKELGKGTGLGMAVVYGIIKQHGGYINVYSEPGRGATFRIYLPLIASGIIEEKKTKVVETPQRGTETILLAEDDKSLRNITKSLLEDFGYTVIAAADGEEAMKKYTENEGKIQLLLFDLIMPKKTGKEAYDEIKNITPHIKVIFSSGYAPDIIRQKGILHDNMPIVYKPISPIDLLNKVRSVLNEGKPSF
jgi:PAS domain S-box-containing protein